VTGNKRPEIASESPVGIRSPGAHTTVKRDGTNVNLYHSKPLPAKIGRRKCARAQVPRCASAASGGVRRTWAPGHLRTCAPDSPSPS